MTRTTANWSIPPDPEDRLCIFSRLQIPRREERSPSDRYLHKSCSLITVATVFIEHAKDSKKLLSVSIPLGFCEMSSKDCLRFHGSKNLPSLPHTEVFMHLGMVSGLSPAVPTDEITYTAERFSKECHERVKLSFWL